jgi:hypothetical protein
MTFQKEFLAVVTEPLAQSDVSISGATLSELECSHPGTVSLRSSWAS